MAESTSGNSTTGANGENDVEPTQPTSTTTPTADSSADAEAPTAPSTIMDDANATNDFNADDDIAADAFNNNSKINSNAPRTKINITLYKKKKSKSAKSNEGKDNVSNKPLAIAEEYSTIAEEAEIISQRRKEEGTVLVIPCRQGKNFDGGKDADGGNNNHEMKRTRPLLARRLDLLRGGPSNDVDGGSDFNADDGKETHQRAGSTETKETSKDNASKEIYATADPKENNEDTNGEDEAVQSLIQAAQQSQNNDNDTHVSNTTGANSNQKANLVIDAPSQNKLLARSDNNNNNIESKSNKSIQRDRNNTINEFPSVNEDEQFKQELSHHAPDVDPTSHIYASVSIRDFGSALLRGMGWNGTSSSTTTGGANSNGPMGGEEIKPRPHRLGLGAAPLPPPSSSGANKGGNGGGGGGGIHRRIRRPEEVRREEERQRAQEEAEKKRLEKKRLDVQYNLQKGSVVYVRGDQYGDGEGRGNNGGSKGRDGNNGNDSRAMVVQTAGVPGLNRILVQMEGAVEEISVTKHSVMLCSWEDLERNPFQKSSSRTKREDSHRTLNDSLSTRMEVDEDVDRKSSSARSRDNRKRSRSLSESYDGDDDRRGEKGRDRYRDRDERRHRNKLSNSRDRSRDSGSSRNRNEKRSRSRDRSSEYRRETSRTSRHGRGSGDSRDGRRDRSDYRKRDRKDRRRDRERHRDREKDEYGDSNRDRDRHRIYPNPPKDRQKHHEEHINWLLPNIRVRLISKKLQKYHLQKGVVQDVIRQHGKSPVAVILMDNGRVIDNIPERYLETALPKTGGNVIVLEGKQRWKKGRLLERSSVEGVGVVQLSEDLEVVKISLDSVAEWCGPLDDDDFE